uniref:COMM domain containing 2 n=1 Tax=Cyprinodon variegatus TaxID=28743 RepID=A0A3Q2E449_CYPVA
MLLVLSEEHKDHLGFLTQVDGSVVEEFCRIALEFLRKGSNPKIYEGAAKIDQDNLTLMSPPPVDFMDSVLSLGFTDQLNQSLLQLYVQHKDQIRSMLSHLRCSQPAYHNLEWRLDVQLASRSLRQQMVAMVTMRLLLSGSDGGGTLRCLDLQTDPSTLLHLISSLEAALAAMKTGHARRILRNIK